MQIVDHESAPIGRYWVYAKPYDRDVLGQEVVAVFAKQEDAELFVRSKAVGESEAVVAAIAQERERCAALVEKGFNNPFWYQGVLNLVAKGIRERGERGG